MVTTQTTNVESLEQMYAAFNRGDIEEVLNVFLADDITWIELEGDPTAGTHHGPNEVLENVFGAIPDTFDHFEVPLSDSLRVVTRWSWKASS